MQLIISGQLRIFFLALCFFLLGHLGYAMQNTAQRQAYFELLSRNDLPEQKFDSIANYLMVYAIRTQDDSLYKQSLFNWISRIGAKSNLERSGYLLEDLLYTSSISLNAKDVAYYKSMLVTILLRDFKTSKKNLFRANSYARSQLPGKELAVYKYQMLLDVYRFTGNDSVFFMLDSLKYSEHEKSAVLRNYFRLKKSRKLELEYALKALQSSTASYLDLTSEHELLVSYRNNNMFAQVDSLFTFLDSAFSVSENFANVHHVLYLNYGHSFLAQKKYNKASYYFLKAKPYFLEWNRSYQIEETYNALIDLYTETGQFKLLSQELSAYNAWLLQKQNTEKYAAQAEFEMRLKVQKERQNARNANAKEEEVTLKYNRFWWLSVLAFIILGVITFAIIINQRIRFNLNKAKLELSLLNSKFKPHFYFNVLSAINYLAFTKDFKKANAAISDLTQLMRDTLVSMGAHATSLKNELELTRRYAALEKLRFEEKFELIIPENLPPEIADFNIPPGLLQPFVENAIKHAFPNKKDGGLIWFEIELVEKKLVIYIKDNGIGLHSKLSEKAEHKSFGLSIIKDRITAINKSKSFKITFDLKNRTDESGTLAVLIFGE